MRRSAIALVLLVATACGGETADTAANAPTSSTSTSTSTPTASTGGSGEAPSTTTGGPMGISVAHPTLSFTAHGPAEPNTFGPSCSSGITSANLDPVRVTVPEGWELRGSSGGSGNSSVTFDVDGARVTVHVAGSAAEKQFWEPLEVGAAVDSVDLAGTSVPVAEVSTNDETGYGFFDVPYLTSLPPPFDDAQTMSVLVTSSEPGLPSPADAEAVLSSARVERCAGISKAQVAMGAAGVLAVPEIVDDPLGKTRPDQEQPPLDLLNFTAYSVEQLAYLLPVPEPADRCVAEILQADPPDEFLLVLAALSPTQGGPQAEAMDALVAGC